MKKYVKPSRASEFGKYASNNDAFHGVHERVLLVKRISVPLSFAVLARACREICQSDPS